MKKWVAVTGVVCVFLLGMIAGSLVTLKVVKRHAESAMMSGTVHDRHGARILRFMNRRLDLSSDQRVKIRGIIESARDDLREIQRDTRPRVREVLQTSREKIRAELNPEQAAKFDEMRE